VIVAAACSCCCSASTGSHISRVVIQLRSASTHARAGTIPQRHEMRGRSTHVAICVVDEQQSSRPSIRSVASSVCLQSPHPTTRSRARAHTRSAALRDSPLVGTGIIAGYVAHRDGWMSCDWKNGSLKPFSFFISPLQQRSTQFANRPRIYTIPVVVK
jgi:hypothetical protein